jgi:hypothetical protein
MQIGGGAGADRVNPLVDADRNGPNQRQERETATAEQHAPIEARRRETWLNPQFMARKQHLAPE